MDEDLKKKLLADLERIHPTFSLHQGFWIPTDNMDAVVSFQRCFQAQETDIIVASTPKSGITWLKALIFSVVNRTRYTPSDTPLLTSNPHDFVPFLDFHLYAKNQSPDLTIIPSPRLFSTHLPFSALPVSMKRSKCPIVYVCRSPFDTAFSIWHHFYETKIHMENFIEAYFDGISWYGPYWDHVLGYWNESLENPNKVLFLKYEEMKEDIVPCLRKIAEFIGVPFTGEEERHGIIQEIGELCSLDNLKNLEMNKKGELLSKYPNKDYFTKGDVGKWVDHLSPSKKEHLKNVMQEKLRGSGLSFKLSI